MVSTREKSVFVPGLLELMGYGRISETAVETYPHCVCRNAARPFADLSPPRVSLALRAVQILNDKPMGIIDDCRTIVRSCVDPRGKSVIVPGLSGLLKRAQDFISSHFGVAVMFEPQPISSKRIWLGFHVVRSGVDAGRHRYCSRVFGAVKIRGIHESGMGPYFYRVRRKCPPLMGLYPPRTALSSSNQLATSQRDWGFSPCRVVSTRGRSVCFPG